MNPELLADELRSSREHLTRITAGLEGDRLLGPKLAIVNPPLWELGHVAWFQEFWCLRRKTGETVADSILAGADALYDSAKVAHDTRWNLPLPDLRATRSYQSAVLDRVRHRLEREPENRELRYFVQLAIFHEDMHAEAFHYTRQTLGYEDPYGKPPGHRTHKARTNQTLAGRQSPDVHALGDVELPGGRFMLGAKPDEDFVFDNEKWAHEVRVEPFAIASAAVTNAEYAEFVEAGGYTRREWWSDEGWAWRTHKNLYGPQYWLEASLMEQRWFDGVRQLGADEPVMQVNWHEAEAYCRYANRRLPTEAEWEYAASWDPAGRAKRHFPWGDAEPDRNLANLGNAGVASVESHSAGDSPSGCRQMIGNVWEWTASAFEPYPGFVVDPYKEYSQPWFHTHKVLRGGSFATTRGLIRNTWRNFYTPDRNDIFAGFRTCAREL